MSQNLEQKEHVDLGNTKTKSTNKQVIQSKYWCFTYNNYVIDELEQIETIFNNNCQKYIFENEIGENGTPHLQGYIELKKKARPSELKLNKKIHWEKCNGSELDNILYCSKDFRKKVAGCKIYKSPNIILPKPLKIISELRKWQSDLEKILLEEPDDRKIIWIYEEIGKVGKSAFSRYMINKYNSLYITEGKKSDIINIVYNRVIISDVEQIILDVPRSNGNSISYKSLEEIKNGIICNTKYETGSKLFNPPHIVVFSNSYPDTSQFSEDRWEIYKIYDNELVLET